jgi:hypothetical protein
MGEKVVNNFSKPIVLDNGTILAASGTLGSMRDDVELSDKDRRRHIATGRIAIIADEEKPAARSRPPRTERIITEEVQS